jgi:hypothetical protein
MPYGLLIMAPLKGRSYGSLWHGIMCSKIKGLLNLYDERIVEISVYFT